MPQIPINPFDNDRLKTRKVRDNLAGLSALPTDPSLHPSFLRSRRSAAALLDRALSTLAPHHGTTIVNNSTTTGQHAMPIRLAATLTPSRVACSVNGDDAIEDTFIHTGFTNVVLSFNGSTVENVAFYATPKTNAELKTLSTLP